MLKVLTVIAGGLLLAGCSIVATPFQVRDVQNMTVASAPATGTAFTQALFSEYQAAAKNEAMVENNWVDAVFFVTKGNKAAAGTAVDPEMAADWKGISPAAATELGGARARLMGYFAAGTRERLPAASARAEVDFDCWVEEESEGGDDTGCKTAFLATEKELQAPAPAPVAAAPKIVKTFIVYFDLNKADITPASKAVLNDVVKAQGEIKPLNIYVTGHTDTLGGGAYNQRLSEHRAHMVSDALGKMGVKTTILDVKAFGKSKLAVPTADNVKEAKNRRVEISFEK